MKKEIHMTFKEWAKIGSDLKKIQNTISKLQTTTGSALTAKEQDRGFGKIQSGMISLKSILETTMFNDIAHDYKDTHKLLDVFYSSATGLEPATEPEKKVVPA